MFKIQPRFTARLDSGGEAGVGVPLWALCSAREPQGNRSLLLSPDQVPGVLPLPTSRFNAAIPRALPIRLHCASTLHASFPLFPQRAERWQLTSQTRNPGSEELSHLSTRGRSFTADSPACSVDSASRATAP